MSLYRSPKFGSRPRSLSVHSVSQTKQCFKDECDVNRIISRYQRTGVLDHVKYMADNSMSYGDFSGFDFRESCDRVIRAEDMFNSLPSSLRFEFQNDPAKFLDFVSDEKNVPVMRKMGLLPPKKEKDEASLEKKEAPSTVSS